MLVGYLCSPRPSGSLFEDGFEVASGARDVFERSCLYCWFLQRDGEEREMDKCCQESISLANKGERIWDFCAHRSRPSWRFASSDSGNSLHTILEPVLLVTNKLMASSPFIIGTCQKFELFPLLQAVVAIYCFLSSYWAQVPLTFAHFRRSAGNQYEVTAERKIHLWTLLQ